MEDLNSIVNQLGLIGIFRIIYPATTQRILFFNVEGTFTKIHHIPDYKTSFDKSKQI